MLPNPAIPFRGPSRSSAVLVITPPVPLDQVQSLRSKVVNSNINTSTSHGISRDLLVTGSSLVSDRLLFCAPESLVYKSRPKL